MREPGGPCFAYGDKNKYEVCEITQCWIWWGGWDKATRRGTVRGDKNGKITKAHIYFWQKRYGRRVRAGFMLAHTCENSICVNPSHLVECQSHENCPINQWHSDYYRSLADIPF